MKQGDKLDMPHGKFVCPAVRTINITFIRKIKIYTRRSKTYIPTRKGLLIVFSVGLLSINCGLIEYRMWSQPI
jgi:hypothetical protein